MKVDNKMPVGLSQKRDRAIISINIRYDKNHVEAGDPQGHDGTGHLCLLQ